jgi:UDP-glucose 4-epimerase
MKKDKIVITGGAGFIGTNLINLLLKKTKYKIISIDNYSSGLKKNHIKDKRLNYIKADTSNISQILKNPRSINSIFHFGEFARIYQSFIKTNECINSNSVGTNAIFSYCLKNKIKLI